jgi:hypothetical protein
MQLEALVEQVVAELGTTEDREFAAKAPKLLQDIATMIPADDPDHAQQVSMRLVGRLIADVVLDGATFLVTAPAEPHVVIVQGQTSGAVRFSVEVSPGEPVRGRVGTVELTPELSSLLFEEVQRHLTRRITSVQAS